MAQNWFLKYKPTKLNEIIGNTNEILKINYWIKNFEKEEVKNIIILGNHGIGKNMIVKLILELNNYYYDWLQFYDDKNKNLLDDIENYISKAKNRSFYIKDKKKYALIISDLDKITLKREKNRILELVKNNYQFSYFPVIFISNMKHNKFLKDLLKFSFEYKFLKPKKKELLTLINKISIKEKINFENDKIKKKVISMCENDIRKLLIILYDLKITFNEDMLTAKKYKKYINISQKKDTDINLLDATRLLINNYNGIEESLKYYNIDKVLIPLTICENYYKVLAKKNNNNNSKILNSLKNVSNNISKGDIIETSIYTDQNWHLYNIHGFYTSAKTSFYINKFNNKSFNESYLIKFSSDLNQTSLKNINEKKNFITLQNIFKNRDYNDLLIINKIVYSYIKNNKIYELYNLLKNYNVDSKYVDKILKIDKTLPKLDIKTKIMKQYNNYIKRNQ